MQVETLLIKDGCLWGVEIVLFLDIWENVLDLSCVFLEYM